MILPVLTLITRPDGSQIEPADELRIGAGLTATYVAGGGIARPGSNRIDIALTPAVALDILPGILPIYDPPQIAVGGPGVALLFTEDEAPAHVSQVDYIADGALTASNTNYARCDLVAVDTSVGGAGTSIAHVLTNLAGTGNWTGGKVTFTFTPNYDLAVGYMLRLVWSVGGGAGQAVPGGYARVKG